MPEALAMGPASNASRRAGAAPRAYGRVSFTGGEPHPNTETRLWWSGIRFNQLRRPLAAACAHQRRIEGSRKTPSILVAQPLVGQADANRPESTHEARGWSSKPTDATDRSAGLQAVLAPPALPV